MVSSDNPTTFTISADAVVTATFVEEAPHSFFQYLPIIEENSTLLTRHRATRPFPITLAAKLETYLHKDPQR